MENLRYQGLKTALALIAVVVTVFSLAMPFASTTAQADEVITSGFYTSNSFLLPLSTSLDSSVIYGQISVSTYILNSVYFVIYTEPRISVYIGGEEVSFVYPLRQEKPMTKSGYVRVESFDLIDDDFFNYNIPYHITIPNNMHSRVLNSEDLIPTYVSVYINPKDDSDADSFKLPDSSGVLRPVDFYSVIYIEIGLRSGDDDPLITISFPSWFLADRLELMLHTNKLGGYVPGSTEDFSTVYNNGYRDGVKVGYENSLSTVDKTSQSYITGRNIGYTEGLKAGGDYSFFGLISAVVDVPVKALVGLLDFNLFGIDMSSLYLSLFTLCIIIMVVKLLL